jgi:hypothetical protein
VVECIELALKRTGASEKGRKTRWLKMIETFSKLLKDELAFI